MTDRRRIPPQAGAQQSSGHFINPWPVTRIERALAMSAPIDDAAASGLPSETSPAEASAKNAIRGAGAAGFAAAGAALGTVVGGPAGKPAGALLGRPRGVPLHAPPHARAPGPRAGPPSPIPDWLQQGCMQLTHGRTVCQWHTLQPGHPGLQCVLHALAARAADRARRRRGGRGHGRPCGRHHSRGSRRHIPRGGCGGELISSQTCVSLPCVLSLPVVISKPWPWRLSAAPSRARSLACGCGSQPDRRLLVAGAGAGAGSAGGAGRSAAAAWRAGEAGLRRARGCRQRRAGQGGER